LPLRRCDAFGLREVFCVAGAKYASHCRARDQLPADAVAAQVDPSEGGETCGTEELDPAQVEDECPGNTEVTFNVTRQVGAIARVNLTADRNHDQIRSSRCARFCPTPPLDFPDMDRIRSVEAARTAWRHHHLLGIGGRG
jgi:hypothetical protein